MKQIYPFDAYPPPRCSEALLQERLEKRRRRRITILLALAGVLLQWAMGLLGVLLWPDLPVLAAVLILYPLPAAAGGGTLAVVYAQKEVRI